MKFVYILSSDEDDYFPEMAMVSMHSLLKYNKNAHIILITDIKTKETLSGNRERIKSYISELITVTVPKDLNKHQISRYLKTSARLLTTGEILYIDNDTIILDNLDSLKDFTCEIGAVLNGHNRNNKTEAQKYMEKTDRPSWKIDKYFNSGVILVKDSEITRKFYKDWHKIWNYDRKHHGIKMDQPSFSLANSMNGYIVEELPYLYNNQIFCSNPHRFFFSPKVIHYFASSCSYDYFPLKRPDILREIRKKGITDYVEICMKNPLEEYLKLGILTSIGERERFEKPLYSLSRKYLSKLELLNAMLGLLVRFKIKLTSLR